MAFRMCVCHILVVHVRHSTQCVVSRISDHEVNDFDLISVGSIHTSTHPRIINDHSKCVSRVFLYHCNHRELVVDGFCLDSDRVNNEMVNPNIYNKYSGEVISISLPKIAIMSDTPSDILANGLMSNYAIRLL